MGASVSDLPSFLERGERARLFPVLADTSKEGRTASILLACLANVKEFGQSLLESVGQKAGAHAKIEAYTEVCFAGQKASKTLRPDGLIVLSVRGRQWKALIEAKVGNADLETEQVEAYLELARQNGIDALITISNQFAAVPSHHPVSVSASSRRKVELYHWSWMHVLTEASLLLNNDDVSDQDQRFVLNEMVRFLTHASAGVKGFEQMPAAWSDLVSSMQAGGAVARNSAEVREVIGAWHQKICDLSLILSRQLNVEVSPKLSKAHAVDVEARVKADVEKLASEHVLTATFSVPAAAAPIEVRADLRAKSVSVSMRTRAPEDYKGTKPRIRWLLRQLGQASANELYVRLYWPGRGTHTQRSLIQLREDVDAVADEKKGVAVYAFELLLVKQLGARFAQRRNFIADLEAIIPEFYQGAGQYLKAWQPSAPKLQDERAEPASVSTEAMQEEAEQEVSS
jgi:hypothetical protein